MRIILTGIAALAAFVYLPLTAQAQIQNAERLLPEAQEAREQCPDDFARQCSCKEKVDETQTPVGPCLNEKQKCNVGSAEQPEYKDVYYSCCVCNQIVDGQDTQRLLAWQGHTFESCEQLCKSQSPPLAIYRQLGAGVFGPARTAAGPTPEQVHAQNALCFTPASCASAEYGGSPAAFRPGFGCPGGQGRCLAPEPNVRLSGPIGGYTTVSGIRGFIAVMFRYITGMIAVVAAIMFMYGGVLYIFRSAAGDVGRAKEIMVDSIVGLVITLGAITILNTINPATTTLKKLDIYLINKQQILLQNLCSGLSADAQFADAGIPPNYNDVNTANFSLKREQTKCNSEYYVKGFGNSRCEGRVCDEPGALCLNCESGLCPPGSDPEGFACVKSTFGGNIKFTDERTVKELSLYAICGNAVKNTAEEAKKGVVSFPTLRVKQVTLQEKESATGKQAYSFSLSPEDFTDAADYCSSRGGLHGFAMAMIYSVPGLRFGQNDEAAVLGKNNCGGSGRFSGYFAYQNAVIAAIQPRPPDFIMRFRAMTCGLLGPLKSSANVWTLEEMNKAIGGGGADPQSISCDFEMNASSAERNIAGALAVNIPPPLNVTLVSDRNIYCP